MKVMKDVTYHVETISLNEFPAFIRVRLSHDARRELFRAVEKMKSVKEATEIVRIEEDATLKKRYSVSTLGLGLAYILQDKFLDVFSEKQPHIQFSRSKYNLAEAIHRWKNGQTDIPVWALNRLVELSELNMSAIMRSVLQYQQPPGIPVKPHYRGECRLPIKADNELNKIMIQLLLKISETNLYIFPKKKEWLFRKLHQKFGEFNDSTSRIPSAIIEILKSHYGIVRLKESSVRIPMKMRDRWLNLNILLRTAEQSSLLLHVISISSHAKGGFEVTSRSESFLQDISDLTSDLGLGNLIVHKKQERPHFRIFFSNGRVAALKRHANLLKKHPDLETWLRIPSNHIADKLILSKDLDSVDRICQEELSKLVESILKSVERKRNNTSPLKLDYMQHREGIVRYFWQEKLIPSPRRVEELIETRSSERENLA